MNQQKKTQKLKKYLEGIAPDKLDQMASDFDDQLESIGAEESLSTTKTGIEKLATGETLSPFESAGLEAIIHKEDRPALFIINNSYPEPPSTWQHFGSSSIRDKLENTFQAIGRIELPSSSGIPYGGTAFVVGTDIIMTNRHVAQTFATGLGIRGLQFKPNWSAGLNLRREHTSPDIQDLAVTEILMVHPYWDMALLRVAGLAANQKILQLTTEHPDNLVNSDIAVVGYPAQDPRNEIDLQNKIFNSVYGVKRLQPGKLTQRRKIESYADRVKAVTHDASTLGGNSGSAVIDANSGKVVALHFAGRYLDANFAVPAYELARDQRVTDTGVVFDSTVDKTSDWDHRWLTADGVSEAANTTVNSGANNPPANTGANTSNTAASTTAITLDSAANSASVTVPLTITVSLGDAQTGLGGSSVQVNTVNSVATERAGLPTSSISLSAGNLSAGTVLEQAVNISYASLLNSSAYSAPAALTCAACCALAYSGDHDHIRDIATGRMGFDDIQFIPIGDTECFVATDTESIVVVFSGAKGLTDWIGNLHSFTEETEYGNIQNDFLQSFLAINQKLTGTVDALVPSHKELILTGHGHGGALATIATAHWRALYPIRSVYTFGQPAVGNLAFSDSMATFNKLFYRLVNDNDIIARLPPLLQHTGSVLTLPPQQVQGGAHAVTPVPAESASNAMLDEAALAQLLQTTRTTASGKILGLTDHSITKYVEKLLLLVQQ